MLVVSAGGPATVDASWKIAVASVTARLLPEGRWPPSSALLRPPLPSLASGVGQSFPSRTTTSLRGRELRACVASDASPDRQSRAAGVGQSFSSSLRLTARPSSLPDGPGRRGSPGFAIPCGVGHSLRRAIVDSEGVPADGRSKAPPFPLIPFWLEPYSVAAGVGNKPEAVPLVRGTEGARG